MGAIKEKTAETATFFTKKCHSSAQHCVCELCLLVAIVDVPLMAVMLNRHETFAWFGRAATYAALFNM